MGRTGRRAVTSGLLAALLVAALGDAGPAFAAPADGVRRFADTTGLEIDRLLDDRMRQVLGIVDPEEVVEEAPAEPEAGEDPDDEPAPEEAAPPAPTHYAGTRGVATQNELVLLARLIEAESQKEPYEGKVAVAAVVLNRVRDPRFPNTIPGVVYQRGAFEPVSNGLIWRRSPSAASRRAAADALRDWDPSYGSVFFWNPATARSRWVWTRPIVRRIGRHVFAR